MKDLIADVCNIIENGISNNAERELLAQSLFYYCSGIDPTALRKNLCKFNNSDKKRYCERLEKQPLNFFTVYNKYRNLSSFFNS